MKNASEVAFDLQAELAALREELARTHATFVNATQVENEKWAKRLADVERRNVELDAHLSKATDFVERLCSSAGNQPSVATGYLRDILDALKSTESGASE